MERGPSLHHGLVARPGEVPAVTVVVEPVVEAALDRVVVRAMTSAAQRWELPSMRLTVGRCCRRSG
jgi:hypothetical protein